MTTPEKKSLKTPTHCEACGKPTWTAAYGKYFVEKCNIPIEYFTLCDACKREKYARKFAEFLK
ncbi:MAG TPA: hypothetical protein PK014_09020 [Thermoanaerobaculia bacterium]|nr:hypothetical protein [Thermoanaerobaculia bacterium]HUM30326.1 hypothetical protein [Thermoanaerobaculia bacterium]HXK68523.1 hypothetical protein [Thermoanaerobaculia bacterium]